MIKRLLTATISLLVLFSFTAPVWAKDVYYLGVLAKRGKRKAIERWQKTAEYLSAQTGKTIKLRPLSFEAIEPAVAKQKIDFLIVNPQYYVYLKKYGATPLATLINVRMGQKLNQFGGVIFVRKDSTINSVADFKGKKFMIVNFKSFGGAHMAFYHFLQKGLNPKTDLGKIMVGKTHDNVVYAVLKGQVDGGTVRTDTLERMQDEGKIKLADFKIIDQKKDDFPFVRSTRLYPEWPFFTFPFVDKELSTAVKKALLSMGPEEPAAKAAKIAGWSEPLDYTPVIKCIEATSKAGL